MDYDEVGIPLAVDDDIDDEHQRDTPVELEQGASAPIATLDGTPKKIKLDPNPRIYRLVLRGTFSGSTTVVVHSRIRSDALGVLTIEEGKSMPSSIEMATNLGKALRRNHMSLSILGARLQKGKQTAAQLEATRLSDCLGRPLGLFLDAQSLLRSKPIATIKFVALRSFTYSISAVCEDSCVGLFGCLCSRAQSSQVAQETSFCPLNLSHLGHNPCKVRQDNQKRRVVNALSSLLSALLGARGARYMD